MRHMDNQLSMVKLKFVVRTTFVVQNSQLAGGIILNQIMLREAHRKRMLPNSSNKTLRLAFFILLNSFFLFDFI